MRYRLTIGSALAAIALIGTTAVWAETGRLEAAETPNASDSSGARDDGDEMMHPGATGHPDMMGGEGHRAWNSDGMGANHGMRSCAGAGGRVEGRLAYARAELRITAAQEILWQAYATAVREAARAMAAQCKNRQEAEGSLPDRLDRHVEVMAARLETMRATNRSLRPLYGALDSDQKKTADEILYMGMMASGRWK